MRPRRFAHRFHGPFWGILAVTPPLMAPCNADRYLPPTWLEECQLFFWGGPSTARHQKSLFVFLVFCHFGFGFLQEPRLDQAVALVALLEPDILRRHGDHLDLGLHGVLGVPGALVGLWLWCWCRRGAAAG